MRKYILITVIIGAMLLTGAMPAVALHQERENVVVNEGVVDPYAEEVEIDEDIFAFRSTQLVGSIVQNPEGENLGFIEDLVIDIEEGCIAFAVLSFGGFLGLGTDLFAIPWQALIPRPIEGVFILDVSLETLQEAEGFPPDDWPAIGDREWAAGIYEYYQFPPHWTPRTGYWRGTRWQAGGWGPDSPYGMLFNPETLDTFESEVIRVEEFVPLEAMMEGVQLIFELDGEPVPVHLGPSWYLRYQDIEIQQGDMVAVTGSHVELDGFPIVIATEIETEEWDLQLRDESGVPVWSAVHPRVEEPVAVDDNLVEIRDLVFIPDAVEVSPGDTVTWINHGPALHTVTSGIGAVEEAGELFDSPELEPSQEFTHTFEETGEFLYFCRFHPQMTGTVVVTK